ncbi:MAG: efflux RND transporter permease subunit, partial [Deltaproteobacteria bacterium]|nr:efflux RND transporter permease subunit [Deltaproteobacteria bacterium]
MIEGVLRFSLQRRALVLGAAVVMLAVGGWRAMSMPIDVFPDLTAPVVAVVTEVTGMAPQEVERLVTFPIETAVNGVPGVRRVRSASSTGISIVWVEFDWDTSAVVARQRVTERLSGLEGALPPDASPPTLAPASSVMGEIAFVALTSSRVDSMELRRVAEVEVRRRLLSIAGISQVVAIGGDERQYQIELDPPALERHGVTLDDVADAVERGNRNTPGGFVVERGQESVVRIQGRAHGVEDLENIVVAVRDGTPVLVRHVAVVRIGVAVRRGAGSYRGRPAVVLAVTKQPGADTIAATHALDEALDVLARDLGSRGIRVHRDIFRQATFIERSVGNLLTVLRDGAVLVALVLLLFLWSIRPTVISVAAIPLSLVAAVLVLDALGMSLDTMTLGGLAIAIGELVDDAIVDVENVVRRLREWAAQPSEARPTFSQVVFTASLEIRTSIVSATLVIVLVFLPLFFLEGLEGRLMRPLAVAYVVAILASLVVALTVTPALCSLLLARHRPRSEVREPPVLRALHRLYAPTLRVALRWPRLVLLGSVLLLVGAVAAFLGLGRSFLPEFNEGSLTVAVVTLPGTSLEQSDALGRMAEEALLADPAVVSTSRRTGRAERDEHVQGVEAAEMEVMLRPDARSREQLLSDVRERLAAVPGVNVTVGQPISHRIDHMVSGQRAALSIKVIGDDLQLLRRVAEEVRRAVEGTPGLVDLGVEQVVDIPEIVVRIDHAAAARYGLSPGVAASAVSAALYGRTVGRVLEGAASSDVVVRYDDRARADLDAVRNLRLATPSGALVPVSTIAAVRAERGPNYVIRENVERRIAVTANVSGNDPRSVVDEVRARVGRAVRPPAGVRIDYAGQFEREAAAGRRLLILGVLVVLGIGIIVATSLGSVRRTLIVLANLPLALAGGVAGVYASGGVLSVASIIGFITLFG